jgi:Leucine-rich repeat (LRR) protein
MGTSVSPWLKALSKLASLKWLSLANNNLIDAALEPMASLVNMRVLNVSGNRLAGGLLGTSVRPTSNLLLLLLLLRIRVLARGCMGIIPE